MPRAEEYLQSEEIMPIRTVVNVSLEVCNILHAYIMSSLVSDTAHCTLHSWLGEGLVRYKIDMPELCGLWDDNCMDCLLCYRHSVKGSLEHLQQNAVDEARTERTHVSVSCKRRDPSRNESLNLEGYLVYKTGQPG